MSNIPLPASLESAKVDTYTRSDGVNTLHVQAMVTTNPLAGTSGTLTAAAQSVTATGLGDMDGVLVATSGTFSGTLAFEASIDGTNWYAVLMTRASSTTQESTRALTGSTLEAWRANVAGFAQFRVRCSAYTSGTATINIQPCAAAFEPPATPATAVTATLGAGTALAGDVSNGVRTTATNAVLQSKIISAATTNATSVKATAGRVYGWSLTNTTASQKFLKLYNKASAPTVGTDVPVAIIGIPPNSSIDRNDMIGVSQATGIAYAITGGSADADTTATAVGDVVGGLFYA